MRFTIAITIVAATAFTCVLTHPAQPAFGAENAAQTVDPTANHYLAFWSEHFQGDWVSEIVEGTPAGVETPGTKGTWSCELAPTKVCMLFSATANGKPVHNAVAGYDPKTDSWKEAFFFADGSHVIQFYQATAEELSGGLAGKVLKGKAELVYANGDIEPSELRVVFSSADRFVYSVINRRISGKKVPDLKVVFERKKP